MGIARMRVERERIVAVRYSSAFMVAFDESMIVEVTFPIDVEA